MITGTPFSPTFRAGFTLVSVAIQNIMACEVFRQLRLQLVEDEIPRTSPRLSSVQLGSVLDDKFGVQVLP